MYRISNKIFEQIKIDVLSPTFLMPFGLDYDTIENFIFGNEFYKNINICVTERNFTSQSVFAAFKTLILELNQDPVLNEENILTYIYHHALGKSFPDTVQYKTQAGNEGVLELALRLFQVIFQFEKMTGSDNWPGRYPLNLLDRDTYRQFDSKAEYQKFLESFRKDYVYEMMKLNEDVIGHNTLDHICGVHHIAMSIARQLHLKGLEVDLGLVSGSAAGHDIGKFGCKPEEASKVAYYHYYYSGEWFRKRDIFYIRNIAINHSTWDLELENLTLESLLLIYSDFRVKQGSDRRMAFYSLDESFEVILNKLDNLDHAKTQRYRRVYSKLKDFEAFLLNFDIELDPHFDLDRAQTQVTRRRYYSLVQGQEIIEGLKFISIRHNTHLMNMLKTENSLNRMLEKARGIDNIDSLRGYINIIEEYYTYLTQKQKLMVIKFLYERLITPEEDVQIESAKLIGELIATFDEKMRKELPKGARLSPIEVNSDDLLVKYMYQFIEPEHKIIEKHRLMISGNLKSMLKSYFSHIEQELLPGKVAVILDVMGPYCRDKVQMKCFMDVIKVLPIHLMEDRINIGILEKIEILADDEDQELRLMALDTLNTILPILPMSVRAALDPAPMIARIGDVGRTEAYALIKVIELLDASHEWGEEKQTYIYSRIESSSDMFLSNLKVATKLISKKLQVEILLKYAIYHKETKGFYTAMHFSNMLKIINNEEVRTAVGQGLTSLTSHLSFEEKNEIVIELLRALELENYQYTKYIPEYLGAMLIHIKPKELDEIIADFRLKIKKSNRQISTLILKTVGMFICNYPQYRDAFDESEEVYRQRLVSLLSIIMNGYVSYEPQVNQMAVNVLGKDIFGAKTLTLHEKAWIFRIIAKKFLSLLVNNDETVELNFLSNSAGIKHLYRFISNYQFEFGELVMPENQKVAYFPGAFDPFSLSHKEISTMIRDLGYEVYLAVDEFSWSKRTQPNLIRRSVIKMSVADEFGLFVFPRDLQINIANAEDVGKLKEVFEGRKVHLVAGSDVILNASAYMKPVSENSIHSLPHVLVIRNAGSEDPEGKGQFREVIGKYGMEIETLTLPERLQMISSSQIRTYIDENRDISELIDPLAQKFIYEKGLYLREPELKEIMTTKKIDVLIRDEIGDEELHQLLDMLPKYKLNDFERMRRYIGEREVRVLILRKREPEAETVGFALFHWLRSSNIYSEFSNPIYEEVIRKNSVGRILVIDGIYFNDETTFRNAPQILLTETLSYALAKDYTYAIYSDYMLTRPHRSIEKVLLLQGFVKTCAEKGNCIYMVNMSAPCTLSLDLTSMIKEPFASNENVIASVEKAREKLLASLTNLYPGQLVLSFDVNMIYENLINKICEENGVEPEPTVPRVLGEKMCVPFGEIFKKRILPNTVTKSMHTEKFMYPSAQEHEIKAYPYYLDLRNQLRMIKSFDRPVILVDDLLNKGYRIKALDPLIKEEGIRIDKVFVGLMSGRGKALMEMQDREVDSAYFIPRLKVWFNESKIYPFLGGDTLWRGQNPERNIIPSINLILPYASARYIVGASKKAIYEMSRTCLINAIKILRTLEDEYQKLHERSLTMSVLPEVMVYPRYPDRGEMSKMDMTIRPSEYLEYDLEHLGRLLAICSEE